MHRNEASHPIWAQFLFSITSFSIDAEIEAILTSMYIHTYSVEGIFFFAINTFEMYTALS